MGRNKVDKTRILNEDGIGGIEYGSTNTVHHISLPTCDEPKRK